jgi:leucyl-tRNA synthetase
MHLLYARFWTKVMADAGIVPFREPFPVLRSQGVMHARDPIAGEISRMSKSAGNTVTPDEVARTHGADALRIYLLFMAPFENNTVWEDEGIVGARRFLERTWRLVCSAIDGREAAGASSAPQGTPGARDAPTSHLTALMHRTTRRVTQDIEAFKFNTAVAALMEYLNAMAAYQQASGTTGELASAVRTYVLLLAPFAPHVAEELWERLGEPYSVHQQPWPKWDEAQIARDTVTLVVQIDGRVRDRITIPAETAEPDIRERALNADRIRRHLEGLHVQRVVHVPNRLVNIVTDRQRM